jgi:hypothetical protein
MLSVLQHYKLKRILCIHDDCNDDNMIMDIFVDEHAASSFRAVCRYKNKTNANIMKEEIWIISQHN